MTNTGAVIGFKDNYRTILKDFVALYLNEKGVIKLSDIEKSKIIIRTKLETGAEPLTKKEVTDEVVRYAIDNDLFITQKDGESYSTIDPILMYLQ